MMIVHALRWSPDIQTRPVSGAVCYQYSSAHSTAVGSVGGDV